MRVKLLNYMKNFFDDQIDLNSKRTKNIVFGKLKDKSTVFHLADILKSHKIKFNNMSKDVIINGKKATHLQILGKGNKANNKPIPIVKKINSFFDLEK